MKKELTERQREILQFIENFIEENNYPPTYREIGAKFNISSTFGVKRHIDALVKKGYLISGNNTSRTLSLVNSPQKSENVANYTDNVVEIPLIGRVAAGYPVLAEENVEGTLTVSKSLIGNSGEHFGLKVRGDSMIEAGILENDVVIVSIQKIARNGDIVVAMLDGETTLKRFEKNSAEIRLIPENRNYPVIRVNKSNEFSIIGKVVGLFRNYN